VQLIVTSMQQIFGGLGRVVFTAAQQSIQNQCTLYRNVYLIISHGHLPSKALNVAYDWQLV